MAPPRPETARWSGTTIPAIRTATAREVNHLAFNDITWGDNGFYRARIGPDACTGLGSPIGSKIAALFDAAAAVAVASAMPIVPEGWSGIVSMLYQDGTPVGEPMLESSELSAEASPLRR